MDEIHTGYDVTVTPPQRPGVTHAYAGQTGRVTSVMRSAGEARVLFPGCIQSVGIPLEYLTRANADDDGLSELISKVANPATLADSGWKNPSKLESYPEYLKLVAQREKLTMMQT
jgi:hypothetical protein